MSVFPLNANDIENTFFDFSINPIEYHKFLIVTFSSTNIFFSLLIQTLYNKISIKLKYALYILSCAYCNYILNLA